MRWHHAHFHNIAQRSLCIVMQSFPKSLTLTALARKLHKSAEVTKRAIHVWQQQDIVVAEFDEEQQDVVYTLRSRTQRQVQQWIKTAFMHHAALGELYFAYGSNLNPERLVARGIRPQFLARAHATEYTLGFPRRMRDGGGVAGMIPSPGDVVEGAIYLFSQQDFHVLDKYENTPISYFRTPIMVTVGASPKSRPLVARLCTITYEAIPGTAAAPSADYLEHIVIGAKFWDLSPKTIDYLQSIEPIVSERHVRSSVQRSSLTHSRRRRIIRRRRRRRR